MLFNSLHYIFLFLPAVIVVYYFFLKRKNIIFSKLWLVISSILFYSWYDPKYTILLITSMLINFSLGSCFSKEFFTVQKHRKTLLIFAVAVNICILGYFKYMNFFIDNVNYIFHSSIHIAKIVLPLGISFFTFTQIAYLADAYKNESKEYSFLNYALFVTFFPHLIAGPILHHKEMMPQFDEVKRKLLNYKNLALGIFLFTIGLFKKTCIADMLSLYVANGYSQSAELTVLEAWGIMFCYTFQIYFDFSGYTDMALGSAKMLNIDLPINFNSPYKAISVQDFWKRWHMTLSRFLRDYIYIPLGGNRKGEFRTYCNLLATMLIGGLWHGASWLFVIWGGLHGLAQCIHKLYLKTKYQFPKSLAIFITFMFVNFTWIIFRAENMNQVKKIFSALFNFHNFELPRIYHLDFVFRTTNHTYPWILLILPMAFIIVFLFMNSNEIIQKINFRYRKKSVLIGLIMAIIFIICIIKTCSSSYSEFIYFNF